MNAAALNLRRNTRLYYAFVFLAQFLLWGGVWIKYLVDDRGLELKYILLMDFPFWMLVALLQAPTGALADHIGRKRVLALSGALYGVTILGFGFTTNYWMLFLDYVIWAFAQSTQTGADQALIYDTLKLAGRESHFKKVVGRGIGLGFFASFMGVVLGSLLASRTSLSFVVQLSAVFPVPLARRLVLHVGTAHRTARRAPLLARYALGPLLRLGRPRGALHPPHRRCPHDCHLRACRPHPAVPP